MYNTVTRVGFLLIPDKIYFHMRDIFVMITCYEH